MKAGFLSRGGLRIQIRALLMVGAISAAVPLYAQESGPAISTAGAIPSPGPGSGLNDGSSPSADTNSALLAGLGGTTSSAAGSSPDEAVALQVGAPVSLSADQLFAILQQNPDAVVELKALMAELSQQQGTPLQPDAITDEMLYDKIASSAELRANITTFLRARGYVTDEQIRGYAAGDGMQPNWAGQIGVPQFMAPDLQPGASLPARTSGVPTRTSGVRPTPRTAPANTLGNSNGEQKVLHVPAPYNLLSLRDLYTQLPERNEPLKRFGSEIFVRHDGTLANYLAENGRTTPLDVLAGPGYVVGPGDSLTIDLWGGVSQTLTRTIDREGKISLPEAGTVQVAGLTLERAEGAITDTLKRQYREVQVAVTVSRLRSMRVYVVGDVQRPGAYEISSLATSLDGLYAAGGPTATGSLRMLRHYRGQQLVGEIDLYDFLLHGIQNEDRLQAGDTLLVPPVGQQVAIFGAVKRPAIYELKDNSTLAEVLEDAGGATVTAELGHIAIDRVDANQKRETVTLELPATSSPDAARLAIAAFRVRDGDRVRVAPILPYSQRVVYLEGHVARPGRTPYRDGMQLSDVLHSYQDLLPEPADRGEIVRLVAPDLHPETINFNVPDAMIGNAAIALRPFDTIRIFGRYEADAPQVTVGGEVLRPGTYPFVEGMTAAQLVREAGGFKRDALLTDADLTSYQIVGGTKVVGHLIAVRIGEAVDENESSADVRLKAGDVLTIHQLAGWNDIGASMTVEGEIAHPGTYGFRQGERLSSVLRRAGGFRDTSYPAGAVLIREDVRKLEEKSRDELIRQIETSSAAARLKPSIGSGDQSATLQLIAQQQNEVLARLRSQPPTGRLVIHITSDISSWENTPADIEVRAGDVLRVPKRPGFVLVSGQVYNASAITYAPGKTAGWYLRRAGGPNEVANTKDTFIIRANGSVIGRSNSWFDHDVLSTPLDPGDVVVVPQKIIGASVFWRNLLTVAQLSSSIAITAAIAGVL